MHASPHNIAAEQAVLATIALKPGLADDVKSRLPEPECFFVPAHRALYTALLNEAEALRSVPGAQPPDVVTVGAELQRLNMLGAFRGGQRGFEELFEEIIQKVPGVRNYDRYVNIVRARWLQRRVMDTNQQIASTAGEPDANLVESLMAMQREATNLLSLADQRETARFGDAAEYLLEDALDRVERARALPDGDMLGLPWGVPLLTAQLGVMQSASLVLVAADPSGGKSTLMMQMADGIAATVEDRWGNNDVGGVGVISMEETVHQLVGKTLYGHAKIDSLDVVAGELTDDELAQMETAVARLRNRRIFIDDMDAPTWPQVRARAILLREKFAVEVIFIDYIQKVPVPRGLKKNEYLGEVISGVKSLAKQLDIPIVCMAQLNRPQAKGPRKKPPTYRDLADSSQLEKDADVVLLLHNKGRPVESKAPVDPAFTGERRPHDIEVVDLIVAKNRKGRKDFTIHAEFNKTLGRFGYPPKPINQFMGRPVEEPPEDIDPLTGLPLEQVQERKDLA